jgi:transposase
VQSLNQLEKLAQDGIIDIYYGDETQVNEEGYVPYGWQFPNEKVSTPVQKGVSINCLGFITRDNRFVYKTTQNKIDADFILEQIENFSWTISKPTVLVIDNAPVHRAKKIKERIPFWSERGLTIFYLPTYSPQLNIAEIVWNQLKYYWLKPEDYQTADTLLLNVSLALAAIGNTLKINFSEFKNRSN